MLTFLVFTLVLISSPIFGVLESLFRTQANCYSGCHTNYATNTFYKDACEKGCDYKFYNENCAVQCSSVSADKQVQASCLVGCSMVDSPNPHEIKNSLANPRPHSIILIRLRQRPVLQLPSFNGLFRSDPVNMFQDLIKQFNADRTKNVQSTDLRNTPDLQTILQLAKSIPMIKFPKNLRADSSSESSEENANTMKHVILHRHEHIQSLNTRFQQWIADVRREWNDLVSKQPSIQIWILLGVFLSLSAMLWYMIVSLCTHAPLHHTLSIRAQELVFDNNYEKDKFHSDDQTTESLPMKMKLSNI